jgi:cytochrome b6-f complex iron-sulfur subunit
MSEGKQSRREFLTGAAIFSSVIIAIGAFVTNVLAYLFPKKREKTYHKYLVAKTDELPIGSAKEITLSKKPVFVVHLESGFRVFSGVCTHLGCIVRWEQQKGRFYCPCHQGFFSKDGKVTGGPPPRPLDEYPVEVENKLVFIKVEDKMEGPWV